ncbi:pseudouridine synthase [Luteibacter rhizovicinus]|nr:pseudouridine synthase [Luteibacter rhizovicinus]
MSASSPDLSAASRVHLPEGTWPTVLDFLVDRFPSVGRDAWAERMREGRVLGADGLPIAVGDPFRAGAVVRYFRDVGAEAVIPFAERIVHVDEHLVVVDKPHFLPVMPAGRFVEETLSRRVVRALGNPDLVALHRLDRGTAGLVLFSACPSTRDAYQRLFRERRIDKTYEALAAPLPDLTFPLTRATRIERGEPFFRMREVDGEPNAWTRIDTIDRRGDRWRYALQPVTGRKHQLRVHMMGLGAPLIGDALYPDPMTEDPTDFSNPLRLLASELRFVDPLDGRERVFRSDRILDD